LLANGFEKSPAKAVSVWNANDVSKWLGDIGLPQYKTLFLQNDVDGQALLGLTKKDLQEDLGIASYGHRYCDFLDANQGLSLRLYLEFSF
jgi:hypothetical protein